MASKQKILIVDDDNNIAELVALYLTKECFETKIVNDGEQALKEFQAFHPNLILLDLMLPGIDGYQVCREIRHVSDIPIIMLSAKGETFDKVLGLELGADDYMIKPFDSKELVARSPGSTPQIQCKTLLPSGFQLRKVVELSGSYSKPYQLFCYLYGTGRWICPPRNWNFFISWLPPQIRFLPGNSFWTISGAMNILVILVP